MSDQRVEALHCTSDFFRRSAFKDTPGIHGEDWEVGTTHFKIGEMCIPLTNLDNPKELAGVLNDAFRFFNWVDQNFEAPDLINAAARLTKTHASMTAGDMVRIGKRYFYCAPVGWTLIGEY